MQSNEWLFGQDLFTIVGGLLLVAGVLVFAWFDFRRVSKLPNIGTVLVKNRLKRSG